MYPTVVMVLVDTQRSMMDVCEISPSNASKLAGPVSSEAHPATSGQIFFAAGQPVHSTTEKEAGSQSSCTLQSQGAEDHGLDEVIFEVKVGTSG